MKDSVKIVIGGIVALILVLVVALPLLASPPSIHQSIVDRVDIVDTRSNYYLEVVFVSSNSPKLGAELSSFTYGETYEHSTWIWQRAEETEWVMTVWGPGDDEVSYVMEFGRVSPGSFDIRFDGLIKVSFDVAWITPADGYWWFETQVYG